MFHLPSSLPPSFLLSGGLLTAGDVPPRSIFHPGSSHDCPSPPRHGLPPPSSHRSWPSAPAHCSSGSSARWRRPACTEQLWRPIVSARGRCGSYQAARSSHVPRSSTVPVTMVASETRDFGSGASMFGTATPAPCSLCSSSRSLSAPGCTLLLGAPLLPTICMGLPLNLSLNRQDSGPAQEVDAALHMGCSSE